GNLACRRRSPAHGGLRLALQARRTSLDAALCHRQLAPGCGDFGLAADLAARPCHLLLRHLALAGDLFPRCHDRDSPGNTRLRHCDNARVPSIPRAATAATYLATRIFLTQP